VSSIVDIGILRESPLAGRRCDAPARARQVGIEISERAFLGHINLRGDPESSAFMSGTADVLGLTLPLTPNVVSDATERTVYWLAPTEWLIVCPGEQEGTLAAGLRKVLNGQFVSVVELGGGQTVLRLTGGTAVRELLAKGCPLDMHERTLRVGQCAQTHLAKAPILLRPISDGIEIVVLRSFADYLWQWLDTVVR
jgi:sarcosine oxidase subunit gamma